VGFVVLAVITFGELLIDFLQTRSEPSGELEVPILAQFPGGAPANVAVAVARLGGQAFFAGTASRDVFGDYLVDALARYGVSTALVRRVPDASTALAFVTLDAAGERSFAFRREATADLRVTAEDIRDDWFDGAGFLHVCSNLLMHAQAAAATYEALAAARRRGVVCSIDLNLRPSLWSQRPPDRHAMREFIAQGDVVKLSREEADFLSGSDNVESLADSLLQRTARLIVVTDGPRPLRWFAPGARGEIQPPSTTVVDTTAAGDAFAGGLLFALARRGLSGDGLEQALADRDCVVDVVRFAARCGAASVRRAGAFPSMPTLADLEDIA